MNEVQKFNATGTKQQIYPWFKAVADLMGEARMNITDQGIDITCTDPANVAMLIAHISTEEFDTFKTTADAENPLILGIDFIRYANIMKKRYITPKSIYSIEALPPLEIPTDLDDTTHSRHTDPNELYRVLFGVSDIFFKYNTLDLLSISKDPHVPQMDLPIDLAIPLTELCNILHAMTTAGLSHVQIKVDFTDVSKPELILCGVTTDNEPVSRTIPTLDLPYFKYNGARYPEYLPSDNMIGSLHSLDYLNPIVTCLKAFGGVGDVRINLGQDYPLGISIDLEGNSTISYLLAPRVDSE